MRWPWQRRETRAAATGFTDLVVAGLLARAAGERLNDPASTAAVEIAALIWGNALASATVEGGRGAVTRRYLSLVGREWIRRGESVHVVSVTDAGVSLLPCASWDVNGSADPASWWYRCDVFAPNSINTLHLPRAAVCHSTWATNSEEPWRGVAPWRFANLSAGLLAALERRLAQEADMPVGALLGIPSDAGDGEANDPLAKMKAGIGDLEGAYALIETTAAGWGQGMSEAPRTDWKPQRLGADPPETLRGLRSDAHEAVLAACGIPFALVGDKDGTAAREAVRRFFMTVVEPKAGELADVLSEALATPVAFSFRSAWAHDLVGRANALKTLVDAGFGVAEAVHHSGLADL